MDPYGISISRRFIGFVCICMLERPKGVGILSKGLGGDFMCRFSLKPGVFLEHQTEVIKR